MAKLVDAPASGAGGCKTVEVRVFFWAPKLDEACNESYRPFSFCEVPKSGTKMPLDLSGIFACADCELRAIKLAWLPDRVLAQQRFGPS